MTELGGADVAVSVLKGGRKRELWGRVSPRCGVRRRDSSYLVEYPESLADLFLAVRVLHFSGHHGQELWEVDGSVTWIGGSMTHFVSEEPPLPIEQDGKCAFSPAYRSEYNIHGSMSMILTRRD